MQEIKDRIKLLEEMITIYSDRDRARLKMIESELKSLNMLVLDNMATHMREL